MDYPVLAFYRRLRGISQPTNVEIQVTLLSKARTWTTPYSKSGELWPPAFVAVLDLPYLSGAQSTALDCCLPKRSISSPRSRLTALIWSWWGSSALPFRVKILLQWIGCSEAEFVHGAGWAVPWWLWMWINGWQSRMSWPRCSPPAWVAGALELIFTPCTMPWKAHKAGKWTGRRTK